MDRPKALPDAYQGAHARWVFSETVDAVVHARSLEHLGVLMRAHRPHVLRLPGPHVREIRRAVSATKAQLHQSQSQGEAP